MEKIDDFAKILFDAYREHAKAVAYDKTAIPEWENVAQEIKDHWIYSATVGLLFVVQDIEKKFGHLEVKMSE